MSSSDASVVVEEVPDDVPATGPRDHGIVEEEAEAVDTGRPLLPIRPFDHPYFDTQVRRHCRHCYQPATTTCATCLWPRCAAPDCAAAMAGLHDERCALLAAGRARTWCLALLGDDPEANVAPVMLAVHVRNMALRMRAPPTARAMRALMEMFRREGLPLLEADRLALMHALPGKGTLGHSVAEVLWLAHLFDLDAGPEAQTQALLALQGHYHPAARFIQADAPPITEARAAYYVTGVRTDLNAGQTYSAVLIGEARLGGLLARDLDEGAVNALYLISLLHPNPKLAHQLVLRLLPGQSALVVQSHSTLYTMGTWLGADSNGSAWRRGIPKGIRKQLVKKPHFGPELADRLTILTWAHTIEMLGDPAEDVKVRRAAYTDVTGVVTTPSNAADEQGFGRAFYVIVTRLCLNV